MRVLLITLLLLLGLDTNAADYAREKKWSDEILPAVLVGDPVWLAQADGHRFLGLYTPATPSRAGVILVHGIGVHPDWGPIGALRQQLPESGYSTLSIQMPILGAEATGDSYPPTFTMAAERLALAIAHLRERGLDRVAIVSHSMGARMAHHFLTSRPDAGVRAWVAIGAPAALHMGSLTIPSLDLFGQNDLPQVLENAAQRARGLIQPGSAQVMVPGADHFFEGQEVPLLEAVRAFLDRSLP